MPSRLQPARYGRAAFLCATAILAAALWPGEAAASSTPPSGPAGLGAAFEALGEGEYERAFSIATELDADSLLNGDYAAFAAAQSAYLTGRYEVARARFRELAREEGTRFRDLARWRKADALWQLGRKDAARERYEWLREHREDEGDAGVALFRIGEAHRAAGDDDDAIAAYRELRVSHPHHALEDRAIARLHELGGERATRLSARDRMGRSDVLGDDLRWQEAHHEVWSLGELGDADLEAARHYRTAMTLFRQRRQYGRAGEILLEHYDTMGSRSARALFHGARALSRVDRYDEAIAHYLRVPEEFSRSRWAPQAQFLAGWLEYNRGEYRDAIPILREVERSYPRSRWAQSALWFRAFSLFLAGEVEDALEPLARVKDSSDASRARKGHYWHARALEELGRAREAREAYREIVGRDPLSWYALLSHARLREAGEEIGALGEDPPPPENAPRIAQAVPEDVASDGLIRRADELLAAGLRAEAGIELRRGERGLLRRHSRPDALATLMDRYREASNYNRPWQLAVRHGGSRAMRAPPEGGARVWWEHAYPVAFDDLVEPWRRERDLPRYFVHAIMRQESGFDPHALSFADARGLIQIIPRTTRRIADEIGVEYTEDMLWDPDTNLRIGTWYLAGLLDKFRGQIPLASGSYNSGPSPVMRWLDENGDHPIDEFVELVSYSETRGYMKLVTSIYARYLYLYEGEVYEQPLEVNADYVDDDLTF